VHTHVTRLPDGDYIVELRDRERVIELDDLGPCWTFGCDTVEEALEVFADSIDALEAEDVPFDTFTEAILRGVRTDDQLAERLDLLEQEFSSTSRWKTGQWLRDAAAHSQTQSV
jgi:hypothetical protein